MSALAIIFLILVLVEFVVLMYLFSSLRKLREAHRVVSEMALDDAQAFIDSLTRAKEQDDLRHVKLIIEEAERYLNSYRNTLQKHYDRYSAEKTIGDFLPFLKKRQQVIPQIGVSKERPPLRTPKTTKKPSPVAEKEEPAPPEETPTMDEKEAEKLVKEALSEVEKEVEPKKAKKPTFTKRPPKKKAVKRSTSKEATKDTDVYETPVDTETDTEEKRDELLPPTD